MDRYKQTFSTKYEIRSLLHSDRMTQFNILDDMYTSFRCVRCCISIHKCYLGFNRRWQWAGHLQQRYILKTEK